ncbi:phosphatases II [Hymenopellis radicata]|nr:phosphatases II [Hymenopellis radicata]
MSIPTDSVSEVVPSKIWLGKCVNSAVPHPCIDLKFYCLYAGITHVLSVCPDPIEDLKVGIEHLRIEVEDHECADLLSHLPRAVSFIQDALDGGGRVLVHCRMGISRSVTVLAAWLIQMNAATPSAAIIIIRKARPMARPNYGFLMQLEAFYAGISTTTSGTSTPGSCPPSPCTSLSGLSKRLTLARKPAWKKKAATFLSYLADTTPIIPDTLYLSSEFPKDAIMAESLLAELGIERVLVVGESVLPLPCQVKTFTGTEEDPVTCVQFIKGVTLVYSKVEARACVVVGAFLMATQKFSASSAICELQKALPLFEPSPSVRRALDTFAASRSPPSAPVSSTSTSINTLAAPSPSSSSIIYDSLSSPSQEREFKWPRSRGKSVASSPLSLIRSLFDIMTSPKPTHDDLTMLSAHLLSESGVDVSAFGDTLRGISRIGIGEKVAREGDGGAGQGVVEVLA